MARGLWRGAQGSARPTRKGAFDFGMPRTLGMDEREEAKCRRANPPEVDYRSIASYTAACAVWRMGETCKALAHALLPSSVPHAEWMRAINALFAQLLVQRLVAQYSKSRYQSVASLDFTPYTQASITQRQCDRNAVRIGRHVVTALREHRVQRARCERAEL